MPPVVTQESPPFETTPNRRSAQNVSDFLALARKRFQTIANAESTQRIDALEDLRFLAGEQWPDEILADRATDGRPCLVINRLKQPVRLTCNQQRMSRPAIQISPVAEGADEDTAEVLQGIIRHIEQQSHAAVAYDTAFQNAVSMGVGYFRVLTDYPHDGTFEQEIYIKRVLNPFSVYIDPACQEADYSDARYAFIVEDIPKDEYGELYGDARAATLAEYASVANPEPGWFPEGNIRIAEYFYVEEEDTTLALIDLGNGNTKAVDKSKIVDGEVPVKILNERKATRRRVKWAKINAAEILEEGEWPGRTIPIVPVLGDELVVNGQRRLSGIVRDAKDSQRVYNYWVSAQTETIALAPRAPFVGAEGQFANHPEWKQANRRNFAVLEYVPVTSGGQLVGAPQRQFAEPPVQAISMAVRQADNDIKSTTGFFDASLGERGPEQSGKAILARQEQGTLSASNFLDNLQRALVALGHILVDVIPKVYDTPRVLRIVGLDDQTREVMVNQPYAEGPQGPRPVDAKTFDATNQLHHLYDLTMGRYDVVVTIGQSFATKRAEEATRLLEFVKIAPQTFPFVGDVVAKAMDGPGFPQIADRLEKMLPPQLQPEPEGGPAQIPPQAQAQMQQMTQMVQMLSAQVKQLSEERNTRVLELASREQIANMQTQAQLAIALAKTDMQAGLAAMQAEYQRITTLLQMSQTRVVSQEQAATAALQSPAGPGAVAPNRTSVAASPPSTSPAAPVVPVPPRAPGVP
jgi:hypothetical protein